MNYREVYLGCIWDGLSFFFFYWTGGEYGFFDRFIFIFTIIFDTCGSLEYPH